MVDKKLEEREAHMRRMEELKKSKEAAQRQQERAPQPLSDSVVEKKDA